MISWFAKLNQVKVDALVRYAERLCDMEMASSFRRAQAAGQKLSRPQMRRPVVA